MTIDEKLDELYKQRDKLIYRIKLEEDYRGSSGIEGMGPDLFEASIEKERELVDKLMDIQAEIKLLESQKEENGVLTVGNTQGLINGQDIDKFIENLLKNLTLDPNKNTTIDIKTKTSITVSESDDDGNETTQTITNINQQTININGEKISHDKTSIINFIVKEVRNGKTVAEAAKSINISLKEVNEWLDNGKNGKGWDDTVFYEKIKKIESKKKKDDVIDVKKVVLNKTDSIYFIIEKVKRGKTISEAAELIDVPLNDVKQWYENGKNGKGWDDTVFYETIKKLEQKTR